ncbi:MAG: DUF3892 domain-containing protein [Myxococcales bacterium]|nr:DUF3892 domain-containing protein [Myxococcales bacterium]
MQRHRKPAPRAGTTRASTHGLLTSLRELIGALGGHRVAVVIARSASGHEYLKTEPDGELTNNLLALPECGR